MYGRDSTLYPRSLEMLDQIDLLDEMDQVGFVARNSVTFDKNGKCVTSRGWHTIFEKTHGTFQDYLLNIRLKYSEEVIIRACEWLGRHVLVGWALVDMTTSEDGFKVTSIIQNIGSGERRKIKGSAFHASVPLSCLTHHVVSTSSVLTVAHRPSVP
jgi:phenol 2-monooxygenase (NADPH)